MNLTLDLLRLLGSPFVLEMSRSRESASIKLHSYSIKNRMSFYFLDTIRQQGKLGALETTYARQQAEYVETLDAISRVSDILADRKVEHVVFKTFRPYTSTTVDIDTLVFGGRAEFLEATKTMQEADYELIVHGPRSITFKDPTMGIGVDLYEQVAVSFIVYINKDKLAHYVTTTILPNGSPIRVLKPEADLASIIAHSVIKEHMYTLSEYFSFIHYLKDMSIDDFVRIANENNMRSAIRTHSTITAMLHYMAHGAVPDKLDRIIDEVGRDEFEAARIIRSNLKAPHKYHPITIGRSLLEIARGRKTRESMASQLIQMFKPNISKDFLRRLIDHLFRESY